MKWLTTVWVLAMALAPVPAAAAHQQPEGCGQSNPEVGFAAGTSELLAGPVRQGDQLAIGARVSNTDGALPCDVENLKVMVRLPAADGSPGETVLLASGVSLPSGSPPRDLTSTVTYAVALNDGVFQAPVSLSWSATSHSVDGEAGISGGNITGQLNLTRPDASLSVKVNPASGPPPLTVTYEYELANTSLSPSAGLPAPALVPDGPDSAHAAIDDPNCSPLVYLSGDSVGLDGTDPAVASLDPGETWKFSCTRTFNLPGTFTSQPSITGHSNLDMRAWPQAAFDAAPVTVTGPDLTVEKNHKGDLLAGETGHYLLRVSNSGNHPTSGQISVTDDLPAALEATAIAGDGWNCSLDTLSCSRSDPLAPGTAFPTLLVTVRASENPPGNVINRAHVSGGGESEGMAANNTASDPTVIRDPDQPRPPVGNRFSILSAVLSGNGSARILARVPGPGIMKLDDRNRKRNLVRKSVRHLQKAGRVWLEVRPTARLLARLGRSAKPVGVKIEITFTPADGASVAKTLTLRLAR